jgi:hypothetical protein
MKTCTKCKTEQPLSNFAKQSKKKDGLRSQCKTCDQQYRDENRDAVRDYHYQNRYGISYADYKEKLKAQNNSCMICGSQHSENERMKTLVVDHCHTTGKVRGLLCHSCNVTLGAARESEDILISCISYLRAYKD